MSQRQDPIDSYRPLFPDKLNPQNLTYSVHYKLIFESPIYKQKIQQPLKKLAQGALSSDKIIEFISYNAILTDGLSGSHTSLPHHTTLFALKKKSNQIDIRSIFIRVAQFILAKESELKETLNSRVIPLIKSGTKSQFTFKKSEILLLICLMAMCLTTKQGSRYQLNEKNNFFQIFQSQEYKTICILQYLEESLDVRYQQQNEVQRLAIKRMVVSQSLNQILRAAQQKKSQMCGLSIKQDKSSIDDKQFNGKLKVDFANSMIGGGALGRGLVQQEIMFSNHPELYVSTLLCESMKENESLVFIGFKKYCKSKGYSRQTTYDGKQKHRDNYFLDKQNRREEYVIAIDAVQFNRNYKQDQFKKQAINRQIMKAYAGFIYSPQDKTEKIVSGNWGCGAFNGDRQLKLLIQWIAASLAGKQLIYCPFGNKAKVDVPEVFVPLRKMKIKDAYQFIISCAVDRKKGQSIYQVICRKLMIKKTLPIKSIWNNIEYYCCFCPDDDM